MTTMTVIAQMTVMTHRWLMKRLGQKRWQWTGQGPPSLLQTPMGGLLCLLGVVVAARNSYLPAFSRNGFIFTCIARYLTRHGYVECVVWCLVCHRPPIWCKQGNYYICILWSGFECCRVCHRLRAAARPTKSLFSRHLGQWALLAVITGVHALASPLIAHAFGCLQRPTCFSVAAMRCLLCGQRWERPSWPAYCSGDVSMHGTQLSCWGRRVESSRDVRASSSRALHWGLGLYVCVTASGLPFPTADAEPCVHFFLFGHTLLKEGAQPVIIIAGPIADCSACSRAAPTKGQQNVNRKRAGRPAGPGERCSCSPRTAPPLVSATRASCDWRRYCQFRRAQRYSSQQQAIMWPSKEKGVTHDGVGVWRPLDTVDRPIRCW